MDQCMYKSDLIGRIRNKSRKGKGGKILLEGKSIDGKGQALVKNLRLLMIAAKNEITKLVRDSQGV